MSVKQRDYQRDARREAFAAWDRGERAHLMAAPTGAGKTLVEAKVAEEWHRKNGGRVLVLAQDSRELVRQLADAFRGYSRMSVGVEMGAERVSRSEPPTVVCATVQTMRKRLADFKRDAFALIVQDEADHAAAKSWRKISDYFWAARIFGCTATPRRHDGLRVPFDSAKLAASHQSLIDGGLIAPIEVRDVRVVNRKLIVLPSGDRSVDDAAVARVWKKEGELHEIVEPTIRLAGERPTIVFAPTVARARELAAMFNRYRSGCARAVWGDMKRNVRAEAMAAYQARKFQFVVNVGVLGRGVDLPFVSCVVMARVTQSRTVYEQAIGRGWRAHPDKDRLLVLDFCENAERHRLIATVALLMGREADEETIERARERLDEKDGGDVAAALDAAKEDLLDAAVRERVRAKIAVRMRTVDLLTDSITEEEWRTKTNAQLGQEHGVSDGSIRLRRPGDIPSPAKAPAWRSEITRKIWAARTPERRSEIRRRPQGALTDSISREEYKTKTDTQLGRELGVGKRTIARHRPQDIPSPAESLASEQRSKAARKAWETRRAKKTP